METDNVFVYGSSGSGKDTVSNYLQQEFGYLKLRLAETIKRIITEKRGVTFDELEVLKRQHPEIRTEHNDISTWLGMDSFYTRITQIVNRTAMDFEVLPDFLKNNPICVRDVRSKHEIDFLLEAKYFGIFLMRNTGEFGNKSHYTEYNVFEKDILTYGALYPNQIHLVDNQNMTSTQLLTHIKDIIEKL